MRIALAVVCVLYAVYRGSKSWWTKDGGYMQTQELGNGDLGVVQANVWIAIATTVLNPGPTLPLWLDYHLRWVQHVVIYMDDPTERPLFETLCRGRPVTILEGSQTEPEMSPESRLIQRQIANMRHAVNFLLERDYTWLVHIDLDELLFGPLVESRAWAEDPKVGLVTFTNHEAIPVDFETSNPFKDCLYFWVNGIDRNTNFMAYSNGKSAVRLGPDVEPEGAHWFSGYSGRIWTPSATEAMILHYPYPSYSTWLRKFNYYGSFPDHWFGDRRAPKIMSFMLQSRDVVQKAHETGDWQKPKTFFHERIPNHQTKEEAISQGKMRHYTPLMNSK